MDYHSWLLGTCPSEIWRGVERNIRKGAGRIAGGESKVILRPDVYVRKRVCRTGTARAPKAERSESKPLMEEFFRWLRSLTASMAASCCVGDAAKGTAGIRVTTDAWGSSVRSSKQLKGEIQWLQKQKVWLSLFSPDQAVIGIWKSQQWNSGSLRFYQRSCTCVFHEQQAMDRWRLLLRRIRWWRQRILPYPWLHIEKG